MVKNARAPKVFFGWWIVLASGIMTFWGAGFGNFGFSALFKPIALELGFSRAATSVAPSVAQAERGLLSPVVGWMADRFGPRWMVLPGVFIIGLSLLLMYFVNSLWAFYLVWGILFGIGSNMGVGLALDKTITNWFVKKRGRALSSKFMFSALSAVAMVPLVAWLVSVHGWRMTCVIAGAVMLIIGPSLGWFFIKQRRPEYYGLLPDGAVMGETTEITQMIDKGVKYATEVDELEFTLRQVIKTPAYWLLLLTNATLHFLPPVFTIHGVPFLTDMEIDPIKAALMIGIMSLGSIPGTLLGGLVADCIKKEHMRFLVGGAFFLGIIGLIAFLLNTTLPTFYSLFVIIQFIGGLSSSMNSIMLARYFGRKAFGSIRGTLTLFMLPATVAAPIYAGWVYDTTGTYKTVFLLCAVLLAFSTVFILLASPPKAPAQVTDISKIV